MEVEVLEYVCRGAQEEVKESFKLRVAKPQW